MEIHEKDVLSQKILEKGQHEGNMVVTLSGEVEEATDSESFGKVKRCSGVMTVWRLQ